MPEFAFVHGGGQGSWVWDDTISAIQSQSGGRVRCLALDVPGCGTKRGRDTSEVPFEAIWQELLADIDSAGLKDVVLVGHSQAGMVLPFMAGARPDLIRRLVHVSCSAPPNGMTTIERMGNGLHGSKPNEVGWPVDPATSTMEERFRIMFCNDMPDDDATAFLGKLGKDMWPASSYSFRDWQYDHLKGVASTFVLCLQDASLPPAWQERFAESFHVSRIVRIDAGHQVMNTRPQALAEVLLAEAAAEERDAFPVRRDGGREQGC